MLLESTVAVGVLLAGSVAAVRLASSQHAYRAASRQTLAADMACENAASWLRSSSVETLPAELEAMKSSPLGIGLTFTVAPFQSGGFTGLHVAIEPMEKTKAVVERNLWILAVTNASEGLENESVDSKPSGEEGASDAL